MIFLRLFWEFFKTGLFSVGGGLATLPFLKAISLKYPWFTQADLLDMIAVSESTPGPLAVNMATFIGSSQAGLAGAAAATLGVVLPSFVIILMIAALIRSFLKYSGVQAFLSGVRPCVVAMILATALTMAGSTLLGFSSLSEKISPDVRGIGLFACLLLLHGLSVKIWKKKPSPILMILIYTTPRSPQNRAAL